MTPALSDKILVVGKKGEIFTTKEIRAQAGLKEGGRVRATVVEGKLVVEAVPSLEEVLRTPLLKVGVRMAERLSEEAQKEQGVFG
jgi:bifunctional DNA-binding transcriptional regulator/antitoxin component of YhaV-PrlF toxin-antitoxin module